MRYIYYIDTAGLNTFLGRLISSYKVFSPLAEDPAVDQPDYRYHGLSSGEPVVYNPYRTTEPLKSFFTYPHEQVAEYFTAEKDITALEDKVIVFGVKNCDIAGHKVQDFVFLEGVEVDTLYKLRKENTVLISGDCTGFKEVCHCLAWDILPYPSSAFDLNLAPLNDGYLAEPGSERGEDLIQQHKEYFVIAKDSQLAARKLKREQLVERLKKHLLPQNLVSGDGVQNLVRQGYNLDTWREFMLTCVECGGCNLICDTCHCFLLADKTNPGNQKNITQENPQNRKIRLWDSCLYANYARVAGGANPLNTRSRRLRNRFMKKFDFFVDNLKMPACCGCGRCIEVCPGKIDIREVLKDLAMKLNASAELDTAIDGR